MKYFIYTIVFIISFSNVFSSEILPPDEKRGRMTEILSDKILVRLKPGYDIFSKDALLVKGNTLQADFLLSPQASLTFNDNLKKNLSPNLQANKIYHAEEKLLRTFIVTYDGSAAPEDYCIKMILQNPAVETAEPYYVPKSLSYMPSDPLIGNQDGVLQLIKAYEAWDIEQGNPDVIIGISDSGSNIQHEDIEGNLGINEAEIPDDGIDNDQNGYIDDYGGYNFAWESSTGFHGDPFNQSEIHGQQVAGIAGATTDNEIGIAGIAFKSRIFPMRIQEGNSLKYAYESIVYAAVRGLKVLNCSWGVVKPFSDIDKSIIDYAISKDVAIVAAAGNTTTTVNKYDVFYPAAYYGVLGVGEVNLSDKLTNSSSISIGCKILAPGEGNYTTTNYNYSASDGGTSFAAPVVAGALALARSRFPQLNALQAIELVRQSVDNHGNFSTTDKLLIPGRLNLLKAVSTDPFSIPAILPHKFSFFDADGIETDRFSAGSKVRLKISADNILGAANNLRFTLRKAHDPVNSITILDSITNISFIDSGEEIILEDFQLLVTKNFSGNTILRVDISDGNGYSDFFKFSFVPAKEISTFSNDEIKLSMSDNGEFGFSTNSAVVSGIGFAYRNLGNQVYRNSSVMLSAAPNKIVYNSSFNKVYSFSTIKGFMPPERMIAIYDDSNAGSQRIGMEVTQEIRFPADDAKSVKFEFTLKNTGQDVITDVGLGLYLDWDVGSQVTKNGTELLTAAIPEDKLDKAAAQMVFEEISYPVFGTASYSDEDNIEVQSAGLDHDAIGSFDNERRYQALNSGMSMQTTQITDVGTLSGIKFKGEWEPGETKKCFICVGAGDNRDELAAVLKNCLFGIVGIDEQLPLSDGLNVFPNPAKNVLFFNSEYDMSNISFSIFDIYGR
ncbi:MAG: S8 family serine peptidase, partial [Candidatus Kapaibacterium sp.]